MRKNLEYDHIHVEPIAGAIGAEVSGVDLSAPLPEPVFREIKRAFIDHVVLFFRDQQLSAQSVAAFAERFGPLDIAPYSKPGKEHPFVTPLDRKASTPSSERNVGDAWHSDQAQKETPSLGFVLYCLESPRFGGDTIFSNLYLAYEALSDGMKVMCDRLTVMHSASGMFDLYGSGAEGKRQLVVPDNDLNMSKEVIRGLARQVEHPLVRVHPESGRKSLFVSGPYNIRFAGMTEAESAPLLNYLNQWATRPEFTCRFRWTKGTLTLLDNRCALHYAINDYAGFARKMLRVEIGGDRPFGPALPKVPGEAIPRGVTT